MAFNNKTILVIAILATSVLLQSAYGLSQIGLPSAAINVNGRVVCSETGNPDIVCLITRSCPGIAGLNVNLTCPTGGTIARSTTDSNGDFNLIIAAAPANILTNITKCNVTTPLPILNCPALSNLSGNLLAPVQISPLTQVIQPIFSLVTSVWSVVTGF